MTARCMWQSNYLSRLTSRWGVTCQHLSLSFTNRWLSSWPCDVPCQTLSSLLRFFLTLPYMIEGRSWVRFLLKLRILDARNSRLLDRRFVGVVASIQVILSIVRLSRVDIVVVLTWMDISYQNNVKFLDGCGHLLRSVWSRWRSFGYWMVSLLTSLFFDSWVWESWYRVYTFRMIPPALF